VKQNASKSANELLRYLLVGGFNTVFGYGLFALLNWAFTGMGSYSYMYAAILANPIAITVAFLGYKWFVFRTSGNYLIEWIRCLGVYSSTMLVSLVGLPVLVPILRTMLGSPIRAPYFAAAIMTCVTVLIGFWGHKRISFRPR
jgi:putative flippase GtrA